MISRAETLLSLYGAWRLALADRRGMQAFDGSPARFWRSFWAAAFALPPQFIMLLGRGDAAADERPLVYALSYLVALVLAWTVWPLAMVSIASMLDRDRHLFRYLTVYNWAQPVALAFHMAAFALARTLLPEGTGDILIVAATLAVLVYEWFIAREGLEVGGGAAAAVVFTNLVIMMFIEFFAYEIARG